jgi:serine/threonine-protein kinase RsbW
MMYESHGEKEKITAVFSAAFENVDILCGEIGRMIEASGLSARLFPLQLVIREAVNNAIVHGSGSDPAKTIKVAFQVRKRGISISVRDHGAGFDWRSKWEKVADPLVLSGRGMELMRTYASETVFNEKGNRVRLKVTR